MDEGRLREQKARGDNARRIFESEITQDVLKKMESTILDSIKQSLGDESDIRERAYLMYRLLENFKAEFRLMINTGDNASKQLLQINEPSRLMRMIGNGRR